MIMVIYSKLPDMDHDFAILTISYEDLLLGDDWSKSLRGLSDYGHVSCLTHTWTNHDCAILTIS